MSFVESYRVTGHKPAHYVAEWCWACAQKEVKVVRDQGPGVTLRLGFFEDAGEPFQERLAVLVIEEDLSSFYSPGHDVLQKAGGVKSGLARHFFI